MAVKLLVSHEMTTSSLYRHLNDDIDADDVDAMQISISSLKLFTKWTAPF